MPLSPEQRRARAQLAALCRWHGKDATLTDEAAARLERAALDRRIDELLAEAPRMTAEQSARLREAAQAQNDADFAAGLLPSRHVEDVTVLDQVASLMDGPHGDLVADREGGGRASP